MQVMDCVERIESLTVEDFISKKKNKPRVFKTLNADKYTTTCGSYCEWDRNVELGPVHNSVPVPKEDEHIYSYYDALQYTLYETNYPETEDRTHTPRSDPPESGATIVVLSSPVECMAILLEGGRTCPGDMMLVMSTTWLTTEDSDRGKNLRTMYVHKAITFDRGGRTYLDVFSPPRRVTYFMDFFTRGITDGQRNDGEELEKDLDCPTSSSLNLVRRTDDKVLTRIQMAEAGVGYPDTLAFCYRVPYEYEAPEGAAIKVHKLNQKVGVENLVVDEVVCFLARLSDECERVVVKPSGVMWHGSQGVTFHNKEDTEGISRTVLDLLSQIEPQDCVLVEDFHAPPTGAGTEGLSFRLRVNVCRGLGDNPEATSYICGVGQKNSPINGDNTKPQSLETTMRQWGLENETENLKKSLKEGSETLLRRIIEHENRLDDEEKGNVGAQTDVIGIDYILSKRNGVYAPIGIEVNSHDCTINCQLYEFMNPDLAGLSVGPLIQTMCERSQRYAMSGKVVVVVGAGGSSKKFIWPAAKKENIRVVLVDCLPNHEIPDVARYLEYDFTDHTQDETHAKTIVQMLLKHGAELDGCCTFWEDCVPLAARICDMLDLDGIGLKGAMIAKKKSSTQNTLCDRTADIPHFPRTYLYAERCHHIENECDLENAEKSVEFPAIMKLEYGSSAVGVKLVHDMGEAKEHLSSLQEKLTCEEDHPGIGLGYGNSMLMMKYLEGTEHDIDVVLYNRKLVAAFVSDNGPTKKGFFTETAACMPSCLPKDKVGQIVTAAYQCCVEIGLVSGAFNVEMKMTPAGPKLIEINARMGGFYLRDWIKEIYGVDLLRCVFMTACGIKPLINKPKPRYQMMGVMCVPSVHAPIFKNSQTYDLIKNLHTMGHIRYNAIEDEIEDVDFETEEPMCNIAVHAGNVAQAKEKLLNFCTLFHLSTEEYDVNHFLGNFKENMI